MAKKPVINADECTGDEICVEMCPEVFKMNDDGIAEVHDPAGAPEDKIQEAMDECPSECITWDED
ncbi:ferredoxin [Acidobacteriota bacterium]